MTRIYSRNGTHPGPLPHAITLSSGQVRTSQTPFTEAEIADAGYVLAPAKPAYDPQTHSIGWDGEGWTVNELPPPPAPTTHEVDTERDRRIAAGFMFGGKLYQSRPEDRENIAGAALAALAAQMAGAQPGDLRWHGGDSDFVWIAADNSLTPMDAQTMFAFGQAAMAHNQAHIFAARALKDAVPIPAEYADDSHWP